MNTKYKFKEQLCISTLSVMHISLDNSHRFEMKSRKLHNTFGYITHGGVVFSTMTENVTANEGDIVFIPEGSRYVSHWDGDSDIRFYSLDFLMPKKSVNLWRNMKLQRIDGAPNEELGALIKKMCACAEEGDAGHLQAFGLFYQMVAMVLPYMKTASTQNLPQPLQNAVAYIEANYTTITSVREIASACFLSESRLYHLFREHLNISPISYLNNMRVHAAVELLANPEMSVQQVAEQLNFHSEYYFRKTFQKVTGELPSKLRRKL